MKATKTPAPRRAGTETKNDRAAREAAALGQLDELREIAPEIYSDMINLLATMVVKRERRKRKNRTKF